MFEKGGHLWVQGRLRPLRLTYEPGECDVREFRTLASGGGEVDTAIEAAVSAGELERIDPRPPRWSQQATQRLRLVGRDEASWDAFERWHPDLGEGDLRDPPIGELLAGWEAQGWLHETALALAASESLVARAASLGVVGRLWEPSTPAEAETLRKHLDRDPNARLIALIESLPLPVVERLESIACTHAAALIETLLTVERQAAAKRAALAAEVRELAYARDDLESVFFVLVQRRRGNKLGEVLARVDDAATSAWSSLPLADSMRGDLRLETVARLEPDAWWTHD